MGQIDDVEYYINGKNFTLYNVYIAESKGVTSKLEVKESLSTDWRDYHGIVVDARNPRYKERTITLGCFIEAFGYDDFIQKYQLFISEFDNNGSQRLKIDVGLKPLVYEVLCLDPFDINKKWDAIHMVGTFQLKLMEPEPVKKVLRHIGAGANTQATITVTSSKLLNIYWGDGTHTFDVSGSEKMVEHTYNQPGEYDIVITGVIEDITGFHTNCIVIWDRLL